MSRLIPSLAAEMRKIMHRLLSVLLASVREMGVVAEPIESKFDIFMIS